jgi:hypothetical protein
MRTTDGIHASPTLSFYQSPAKTFNCTAQIKLASQLGVNPQILVCLKVTVQIGSPTELALWPGKPLEQAFICGQALPRCGARFRPRMGETNSLA